MCRTQRRTLTMPKSGNGNFTGNTRHMLMADMQHAWQQGLVWEPGCASRGRTLSNFSTATSWNIPRFCTARPHVRAPPLHQAHRSSSPANALPRNAVPKCTSPHLPHGDHVGDAAGSLSLGPNWVCNAGALKLARAMMVLETEQRKPHKRLHMHA